MFNRHRFGIFAGFLCALNIAGLLWIRHEVLDRNRLGIRVLSALPTQNIDATDRFSLIFDTPVAAAEILNQPLDRSPFILEPLPEGHWSWTQPNRLDYVLRKPLAAGRVYTLRAAADIEMQTGRRLVGESTFRFATRSLQLNSCNLGTANRSELTIEFHFNQPVNPDDLLDKLELCDPSSHHKVAPVALSKKPAEKVVVRCNRPGVNTLNILIKKSLTGAEGQLPLGSAYVGELHLPELFSLMRAEIDEPGVAKNIAVELRFNAPVDHEQTLPNVQVKPAVPGMQTRVTDGSLVLEGRFECGKRYTATVSANLLSSEKKTLGTDQSATFEIPDRRATIHFPIQNGFLSPGGNLVVNLHVVNVNSLALNASRLHANNLCAHLRGNGTQETSREVAKKTVRIEPARNIPTPVALDLRGLLGEPLGVYSIEAQSTDRNWTRDSVVVAITDIAITTKTEQDGLLVWVTSLRTAKPIAQADVSAITYNGQILATAVTDAEGVARLNTPAGHPDGVAWIITAQKGNDLSYLCPEDQPWVLDDVDQTGRDYPTTYDVMLYTERGVYRPGDTIHLTGIIRDTVGQIPPSFPLSVTVKRPDGREVAQLPTTPAPGQQGMFHLDYTTRSDCRTGPYRFTVTLPGAKDVLGQTHAYVEEFIPARLEVKAEPSQPRFAPNDDITINVASRYLFDQPAADLPLTANGSYRRTAYVSKRYPKYRFDTPAEDTHKNIEEIKLTLDAKGRAVLELNRPEHPSPGLWTADVTATVTEAGGRSISRLVTCQVDTADRHIGLRLPGGKIVTAESPVKAEWVQVTHSDETAPPGPVAYALSRVQYDTTYQSVEGRMVWKTVERLTRITEGEIEKPTSQPAEGAVFEVTCPMPGRYRLQVTDCYSGTSAYEDFDATEESGTNLAEAVNHPERLELVLDKDTYVPGSTARLLVKSPFAGTLLLTVETDRVIERHLLDLASPPLEYELTVDDKLRGGAFLSATVIRPIDPSDTSWRPHRAMGMVRLATTHEEHQLPVTIQTSKKAQPGEKVSIAIQTHNAVNPSSPPVVHLWAVDEGVLMTTDYETPSALKHFFAPRRASVVTADLFDELLPDHKRPAGMTRIGGDGGDDEDETLRRSPVPAKRRLQSVVWNQSIVMKPDGSANVDLVMPNLTGEMRIMAVAVDHDLYGSSQHALTLTKPLLAEMSVPRFAAPGDQFDVPVKLFNSTGEPLAVTLAITTDGPLTLASATSRPTLTVLPGAPATVWLRMKATDIGSANMRVEATAKPTSGEALLAVTEAEIPVRPTGPLHAESWLYRIDAGQTFRIEPPQNFLPGSMRTTLNISAMPGLHLQPALERLIDYPYGCVEQTTSRLFAMLYAPDLLVLDGTSDSRAKLIGEMIDAGISRLWSMQTRYGGLGYWPDATQPDPWGTSYAAEFLIQAMRAGRKVDPQFITELAKYLEGRINDRSDEAPDDNMRATLCYVLAAFKHPQQAWMEKLTNNIDSLDVTARAHVAAAWLELGRKDRATAVLTGDLLNQTVATSTGTRLVSQVRQESVLLGVLLDLDRKHPWIPALVERLEKSRRNGCWGSTLENASALAVLARFQSQSRNDAEFQGKVVAANTEPRPFDHKARLTFQCGDGSKPIEITSTGHGDIYISATTKGLLRKNGPVNYDHHLKVTRRWFDRQGAKIDPARLKVGDLVMVEITITAPATSSYDGVENIAIVDALPAGLEAENPQLATSERPDHEGSEPDRVEFRDDRVVLFTFASSEKRTYRYALRAITAGSFELPPIQASCMYDEGIASVHAGGRVEVAR